jgi:hypothetical protein
MGWDNDPEPEEVNSWLFSESHHFLGLTTLINKMEVEVSEDETECSGRKIRVCLITIPELGSLNWRQPFYQSTGRNSGKPGVWFPFWGCSEGGEDGMHRGWFRKQFLASMGSAPHIASTTQNEPDHWLYRFGTRAMQSISEALGKRFE